MKKSLVLAFVCNKWGLKLETDAYVENYWVSAGELILYIIPFPSPGNCNKAQTNMCQSPGISPLENCFCYLQGTICDKEDGFWCRGVGREGRVSLGTVGEHLERLSTFQTTLNTSLKSKRSVEHSCFVILSCLTLFTLHNLPKFQFPLP